MTITLDDLNAAMRAVRDDAYREPTVLLLHPATYRAFDWELRRTRIEPTYDLVPGAALARRGARAITRWRRRLRWWRQDRQERKGR